ncbi:hypothetical protein FRC11_001371, partial [Ceratobasidium sp. 423]
MLRLSNVLSKVLARPRDRSVSSQATRSSLPDSFNVGLTYDWSEGTLDAVSTRTRPTPTPPIRPTHSRASPGTSSTTNPPVEEDPDIMFSSTWTPLSSSKSLTDPENHFSSFCEQDMLNEPLRSFAPRQLEETHTDDSLTRKRKDRPSTSSDAPIRRSKQHRGDLDIIDIDDNDNDNDEEHDDDWDPQLVDTGYQTLRTSSFSIEHTPTFDVEASVAYPGVSDNDSKSWINANQYDSHVSQTPALLRAGAAWL